MWRTRGGEMRRLDGEHKAGSDSSHPVDTASLKPDERVCGSPTREKTQRACRWHDPSRIQELSGDGLIRASPSVRRW